MKNEPVLPCVERLRCGQGGKPGDGFGVPDHEDGRVLQPGRVEQRRPIEPGSFGGQFLALPGNHAVHVLGFDARGMRRRHFGFEHEYAGGARGRLVEARQLEHGRDMRLVLFPQFDHVRSRGEIVIAVRHPETALKQIGEAVRGVCRGLA